MAGNATIGALRVQLGLDTAQFETGLKKSQGQLSGFGKAAGLAGAAIAAAFVGAGVAMAAAIKGAIDNADEMSKAAQRVGVSIQELQRLKYAADLAGVSMEGLTNGLKRLSKNMLEVAQGGGGPTKKAFEALGISATDSTGRLKSASDILSELAGKFQAMPDGALKTAYAISIFGKAGADMIPLLNAGTAGLEALKAEADELGIVFSQEAATAAEEFNDNITRLQAAASGVSAQLASGMLPALESVSGALVDTAKNTVAMEAVAKVLGGTVRVLATAIVGAAGAAAYLGTIFGGVLKALNTPVSRAGDALKALDEAGAKATEVGKATGKAIGDIWTNAARMTSAKAPAQGEALASPIIQGAEKAKKAAKDIEDAAERAAEAADRAIQGGKRDLGNIGLSSEEQRAQEFQILAAERIAAGDTKRAEALLALAAAFHELIPLEKAHLDLSVELINTPKDLAEGIEKLEVDARTPLEKLEDAFNSIGSAVDDIYYGVKNRDWVAAFSGLMRAIKQVQEAFKNGTATDKVNAVAAVGQQAGSAIGGKLGGTISGAAGGAAIGMTLGGPIGAGIGAIVGGALGFLGASKAAKRAKREEAARRAQEEANRLQAIANQRRELEIALLEAQGKSLEATAERRKDELAAMGDDTNRQLAQQLYDLADAAEARAKAEAEAEEAAERAATLAATRRDLEIELLEAQGRSVEALALRRQDELAAMDDSLDSLLEARFAAEDLAAANEAAADAADKAAEAAQKAAEEAEAAAEKAAEKARTQREFEIEIMEALGDASGALAARRQLELDALDDEFDGMQRVLYLLEDRAAATKAAEEAAAAAADIAEKARDAAEDKVSDARNALSDAYEREADALRSTISRFREFADNLRSFRESLSGELPSGGASIAAEFKRVAGLARLGNEDALGALPGVSQRFLDAQKASARSLTDYLRSVGVVRAAVQEAENTANRTASIAEQQLESTRALVEAALGTQQNTLTIAAGIDAVNIALADLTAATKAVADTVVGAATSASELAALRTDLNNGLALIAANTGATADSSGTTANVIQRVTRDGDGMVVAA